MRYLRNHPIKFGDTVNHESRCLKITTNPCEPDSKMGSKGHSGSWEILVGPEVPPFPSHFASYRASLLCCWGIPMYHPLHHPHHRTCKETPGEMPTPKGTSRFSVQRVQNLRFGDKSAHNVEH